VYISKIFPRNVRKHIQRKCALVHRFDDIRINSNQRCQHRNIYIYPVLHVNDLQNNGDAMCFQI
jgi:hypothetical protein